MLLIFDWDGTLLDSTAKIIQCMRAAIADQKLADRSSAQVREIIGLGLPEAIRHLYPGIDEQGVVELQKSYSQCFIEADKLPCDFYDGVMDTLIELRTGGHQLAIATGKSRKGLDRVLAKLSLEDFFDASRCADETRSKPHPLMLEELLGELGSRVENALMIGDTEFDMAMACNAGMNRIAVSYGAHERDRLLKYQPSHCIDYFPSILACVHQGN